MEENLWGDIEKTLDDSFEKSWKHLQESFGVWDKEKAKEAFSVGFVAGFKEAVIPLKRYMKESPEKRLE